jgi:dephospho-CoA kinase
MIVGITGGIGSGKSTVSSIFSQLDIAVYNADEQAKALLDTDENLKSKLVDLLGSHILKGNYIDRAAMAKVIFNDEDKLQKANAIIHPAVALHFKKWYKKQSSAYVLREAAILFESGSHKDCDFVITVYAPEALRIKRVQKRSGMSAEEIKSRISKQWPEEKKMKLADAVIYNDGSKSLIKQVLHLHETFKQSANTGA